MSLLERVVLVVDDDPEICWVLEHLVESLKGRCVRAPGSQGALQAARLDHPDLVLLDAKLPDIDGLALARQIRRADPDVPIILISGYFYRDDPAIQAARDQGLICGFAEKPFSHREIILAIKTALSTRGRDKLSASEAAEPLTAW